MKRKKRRTSAPNSVLGLAVAAQLASLISVGLLAVALAHTALQSSVFAQGKSVSADSAGATPWVAVHVLGFENVKRNAKGRLTVQSAGLQFEAGKAKSQVSFPSIQDVYTDDDNRLVFGGKPGTLVRAAMPYETGRILALFQEKVDVLTLEYQDSNGALHGAIFRLAKGQSVAVKRQLVAQGVHVSIPVEQPAK